MGNKSKSFLLFVEQREAIGYLTDEEAGRLIKSIYDYADEGIIPQLGGALMSLFSLIRSQIDRSQEAYKARCEQNRINSRKRKQFTASGNKADSEPSHAAVSDRNPSHAIDNDRKPSITTDNEGLPKGANDILPNPNPSPSPNPSPDIDDVANTNIINEAEVMVEERFPFDEIWKMYGKPVGDKESLRNRWNVLSGKEKEAIFKYVPLYVQSRPETKYRKDFANFLTCRTWETEPITNEKPNNGNKYHYGYQSNEEKRNAAFNDAQSLVTDLLSVSKRDSDDAGSEK